MDRAFGRHVLRRHNPLIGVWLSLTFSEQEHPDRDSCVTDAGRGTYLIVPSSRLGERLGGRREDREQPGPVAGRPDGENISWKFHITVLCLF